MADPHRATASSPASTVYDGAGHLPPQGHRGHARRRRQRAGGRRRTRGRSPSSRSTTTDNVVLLRQYRHPVGRHLWELPAGLRDADGEPPLETAKRELAEEALLAAERWSLLTTTYSTPGFCDEAVLVYLAEDLTDVERPEGFTVEHEEADMTVERVPLADAVQRVFAGDIRNALAVIGLLAAAQVRRPRSPGLPTPLAAE